MVIAVKITTFCCFYYITILSVTLQLVGSTISTYKPQFTDDNELTRFQVLLDRIKRDVAFKKRKFHDQKETPLFTNKKSDIYKYDEKGKDNIVQRSKRLELTDKRESLLHEKTSNTRSKSNSKLTKRDGSVHKSKENGVKKNTGFEQILVDEDDVLFNKNIVLTDQDSLNKKYVIVKKYEHKSKRSKSSKPKRKGDESDARGQLPTVILDRIGGMSNEDETDDGSASALDVTNAEVQTQGINEIHPDESLDALERPKSEMNHNELNKLSSVSFDSTENVGTDENRGIVKVKTVKDASEIKYQTVKKSVEIEDKNIQPITEETHKRNNSLSSDMNQDETSSSHDKPVNNTEETNQENLIKQDTTEFSEKLKNSQNATKEIQNIEGNLNDTSNANYETEASQNENWTAETASLNSNNVTPKVSTIESNDVDINSSNLKEQSDNSIDKNVKSSSPSVPNIPQKSFSDMIVEDVMKKNNNHLKARNTDAVAQQLSNPDALMKGIGLIPTSDVKTMHNPITGQRILPFLGNRKTAKHFHAFMSKPNTHGDKSQKQSVGSSTEKVNKYVKPNPFHHHHNLKYMYPLNYNSFLATNMMMNYSKNNNFNNVLKRSMFLGYPRSLIKKPAPLSHVQLPVMAYTPQTLPPSIPMMTTNVQPVIQNNQPTADATYESIRNYEQHTPARLSTQPFAPPPKPKPNIYDNILKSVHTIKKVPLDSNKTTSFLNSFYQHVKKITTDKNFWAEIAASNYTDDGALNMVQLQANRKGRIPRNLTLLQKRIFKQKLMGASGNRYFKQKKQPLVKCYKGHCQKVRMYTDVKGSKKDILIGRLAPMLESEYQDPYGEYASEINGEQLIEDAGDDGGNENDGVNFEENNLKGKTIIRKFMNGESPKGIEVQEKKSSIIYNGTGCSINENSDAFGRCYNTKSTSNNYFRSSSLMSSKGKSSGSSDISYDIDRNNPKYSSHRTQPSVEKEIAENASLKKRSITSSCIKLQPRITIILLLLLLI